jgi:hypothetical protein
LIEPVTTGEGLATGDGDGDGLGSGLGDGAGDGLAAAEAEVDGEDAPCVLATGVVLPHAAIIRNVARAPIRFSTRGIIADGEAEVHRSFRPVEVGPKDHRLASSAHLA